jgi:hypothetical protein
MLSVRKPWAILLVLAGVMIVWGSALAPLALLFAAAAVARPWVRCWRAADGTSLRPALIWTALAMLLAALAQFTALGEALASGRPWTGRLTYLMVLALVAALISVLGARRPGSGAWAILMVLLVVVFLIPWLEAAGRVRRAQGPGMLQLDSPWTLFYGLLVLAGVTNYLPTRYGLPAAVLGAGLVGEYLALTRTGWSGPIRAMLWEFVVWTLSVSGWCVERRAPAHLAGRNDLERLWLWFRDHWGMVWALRILDRFNRSAELARWSVRLTWYGLAPASPAEGNVEVDVPVQAQATLRNLMRRFVNPERIDALLAEGRRTCDSGSLAR